jgi:hypothetical protein
MVLKPLIDSDQKPDAEAILGEQAGCMSATVCTKKHWQPCVSSKTQKNYSAQTVPRPSPRCRNSSMPIKARKIELLAKENDLKDAELHNRRLQQMITALGGVIAVMAGFFVYLLYRR